MNAQLRKIARHFQAVTAAVPLHPIRTEAEHTRAVTAMNRLIDGGAGDEQHSLADLLATLGELIADYEDQHVARRNMPAHSMLRFLMDQHGLKRSDLPEVGSQGVVSELLSGSRELNLRQIRALAARFGVAPAAFLCDR